MLYERRGLYAAILYSHFKSVGDIAMSFKTNVLFINHLLISLMIIISYFFLTLLTWQMMIESFILVINAYFLVKNLLFQRREDIRWHKRY